MRQTQTISVNDVALLRRAATGELSSDEPVEKSRPARTRPRTKSTIPAKRTPQGNGSNGRGRKKPSETNAEERLAQIVSLLLGLVGLLLFIALVSYSRLDHANADIRVNELSGLVTNDPGIAARADTTTNWLGLVGAFVSNALINGLIGWFSLIVPGVLIYWSLTIYKGWELQRTWRQTFLVAGSALLLAGLVGTFRLIDWMPTIAYEGSGAVGDFMASIFSGLLGTIGSTLILSAGILIVGLYLFDTDLKRLVGRISPTLLKAYTVLLEWWSRVKVRVMETVRSESSSTDAIAHDRVRAKKNDMPLTASPRMNDEEPARMIRRFAGEDRVEEKIEPMTPVRPVVRKEIIEEPARPANPVVSLSKDAVFAPKPETKREPPPLSSPVDPAFDDVEEISAPFEHPDKVILSRAPLEEMEGEDRPSLRVHVEEGESDDDLEIAAAGKLVDLLKDEQIDYDPPRIELLSPQEAHEEVEDEELKLHARLLQEKLRTFNIEIEDLTVTPGPVVTLFEFVPAAGIKLSQIESLSDDIALALKARGIRIIAPIPGKGTVGVEIPNRHPAMVRIRSVLNTTKFREADLHLPLALGKTTVGEVYCTDLSKMPHLLIAGATGAGKSVGINSILASLIYKMHPSELKLAIIDPKKIELTQYRSLINHYLVHCPDIDEDIVTDPQNAVLLLKSLELEMDRRYDMLAKSGQRNLLDYNKKIEEGVLKPTPDAPHVKLPYIVLIIDELADLMITAAKEVEEPIARLAQLARAIGIHIIVATQRPSVDVLTGMIKANFPARIAYQVATKVDSRTILDMNGAEQLLGNGDMLYLPGGRPKPIRLQNAYISTDEVEDICNHIGEQKGYSQPYTLPSVLEKRKNAGSSGGGGGRDDLFDEAAHLVVRHQQGSVSLLQRRLKVGYARAARIVDELEDAGILGPFDGSKARMVMLESEAELEAFL